MFVHLAALLLAAQPVDLISTGTQLVYRGQFYADRSEPGAAEKSFELSFYFKRDADAAAYWMLEERGRGGWLWLNRFGRVDLDAMLRRTGGTVPTLLDQRDAGTSLVTVLLPFLGRNESLHEGMTWTEGGLEHNVVASERIRDSDAWRIEVRNSVGRKRTLWVDKSTPTVLALNETVFIGQGEQHTLRYELSSREMLPESQAQATFAACEELLRLRESLGFDAATREFAWTAKRLAQLKSSLPALTERAAGTPLTKIVRVAEQQLKAERDRSNALGAFHTKLVDRVSPRPDLVNITGEKFSWDNVQGKVTVLHFWEYRDLPLEEPYGQVAYLDFLYRKHPQGQVQMYGVVADERALQPDSRRAAIQSARRFHAFMNLSYPLLVDGGDATKQFGDPRVTGAKLPLFIVIDRAGKVVHYHVGHYEVNRDRGLEELESVVKQALENRG